VAPEVVVKDEGRPAPNRIFYVDGRQGSDVLSPEPALAAPWHAGDFTMTYKQCPRLASRLLLSFLILMLASTASAEWKEKVLYSFQGGTDGYQPAGGVVFDKQGNLYGATTNGGSSSCRGPFQCGTVFQLKPPTKSGDPWTETVLYVFKGSDSNDGASPFGGLILDQAGNLYGTTGYDGTGDCILLGSRVGCGTVYELSPPTQKGGAWTETVLYNFKGDTDGQLPVGDLVFDEQGNLYGATQYGGGYGSCNSSFYQHCGTIFKLSPPKTKGGKWTEKVLHGFKGGKDGANPNGGLVFDSKGAIYGTTFIGGYNCPHNSGQGCGTVFKLLPPTVIRSSWAESVLYKFSGPPDGSGPAAGVIFGSSGPLYGTTANGGKSGSGQGTVFQLVPGSNGRWREKVLYSFQFGNDGNEPRAGVILDAKGNLYGTSAGGGAVGGGTVFRLKPKDQVNGWAFGVLYTFMGSPDGSYPASNLIFDEAGNLYGTTQQSGNTGQNCGHDGCGTVFEVSP
jgi:uncharacterized repeat protein (TIGR03803 family)